MQHQMHFFAVLFALLIDLKPAEFLALVMARFARLTNSN